jgi:hypothetical protein
MAALSPGVELGQSLLMNAASLGLDEAAQAEWIIGHARAYSAEGII